MLGGLLSMGSHRVGHDWSDLAAAAAAAAAIVFDSHISCMCLVIRRVWLFATPWAIALQAPLSMGFSRQEYWGGLPCPPPGIFLTQGMNPSLLPWQVDSFTIWATRGRPSYLTECESRSAMSDSLRLHGLYSPWNSLGQNTGVGSLSLLQGIFPTQGLNPGLLHYRQILYQLSHKRSLISYTTT